MRTFAILAAPFGTFAVTANADGSVGINAQVVAERDKHDREGKGLAALVDQANAARGLWDALAGALVALETNDSMARLVAISDARASLDKYRGIS